MLAVTGLPLLSPETYTPKVQMGTQEHPTFGHWALGTGHLPLAAYDVTVPPLRVKLRQSGE